MEKNQVPWLERISYGLSDTGFNLMFTMMSTYLLYFYTDVFGVAAALIAPVFLVGRIIDGFTDPFEGILMDRVHTRWGRSRPFWLWFSIPWAILAVLVFSAPDIPDSGKIVYICASVKKTTGNCKRCGWYLSAYHGDFFENRGGVCL